MTSIVYTALTRGGETVRGELEAPSVQAVLGMLDGRGLTPVDVRLRSALFGRRRRIPAQIIANAVRRMAQMLKSGGIPLPQVLASLAKEEEHPRMRAVLMALNTAIAAESLQLSAAMARMPEVFPEVAVRRIAAGEEDGTLDDALEAAAGYLLHDARTRQKIGGAMAYPILLLLLTVGIISTLSVTIMPRFASYYRDAGVALPPLTRLVLGFGGLIAHGWPFLILFAFTATTALGWALTKPSVRELRDQVLWYLPIWRRLARHTAWSRFAEVLGVLYGHGIPLLQALDLAARSAGTAVIVRTGPYLVARVGQGTPLADALSEAAVFPPTLLTTTSLGQLAGTLDRMLGDIAAQYVNDVDLILEQFPQLLQPLLIVVVGGIVGVMLIGMYWPMFHLASTIGGMH